MELIAENDLEGDGMMPLKRKSAVKFWCWAAALLLAVSGLAWPPAPANAAMATNIEVNPIPNNVHRLSPRFTVTANGVNVPVVDGQYVTTITENGTTRTIKPDYLGYDFSTFTASEGDVEIVIGCRSVISSIIVSPLQYGVTPVKVDDYTYKFTVSQPHQYLIVSINGNKLVVTRDEPESYVPTVGAPGVFNVRDYLGGVDPTQQGNMLATAAAFQQAANDASLWGTAAGGGKKGIVYVPAGLYYMGNLKLKSNTALYLAHGSVLRMTDDYSNYSVDFYKSSLGRNGTWWISTENNSSNIKIFGRGTIDGNGHYFQKDKPASDPGFAAHLIAAMSTSNFTLEGPVIMQAPFWGTITARSDNINISNVKFFNSLDANENDCLDINESQHVHVWDSIGISLDDNFSTKTWEGNGMSANWYGTPEALDDVTFNNVFGWSITATFKLGHGAFQPQSNITFKNSVTYDAGRAIGIEHRYGAAPWYNITFDTIDIENAGDEGWFKAVIEDGGSGVGPVSNIAIKNINVRHKGKASSLKGYSSSAMISNIAFDNIKALGNPDPVSSLAELNVTNTGFYQNATFVPDRSADTLYRIEAENNNGLFGTDWNGNRSIKHIASTDTGNVGYMVGQIANGNYALYKNVSFGADTSGVNIRYDAPRAVRIELHLDSPAGAQIGAVNLPGNGNTWTIWNNYNIPVSGASGTHDLYFVFKVSGSTQTNQWLGNLNWFELTRSF